MVTSTSRAYGGPLKYIQGPGEFGQLETYTRLFGKRSLFTIDGFLYEGLHTRLQEIYGSSESEYQALRFGGECCEEEFTRLIAEAAAFKAEVLIAVGGGKTMDTVKIAANEMGLPLIIVPTSASTDAPTSAMSVVYTRDGVYVKNVRHKRHADMVLMDTEIIAKAPIRLFVAGMGDALATYIEALASEKSGAANFIGKGYRPTKASMAISRICYDTLMADGIKAKQALERGVCTEAVENIIEANTLLSGLGFENAGLACAHGIHSGLTELSETHRYFHGEKVAFGIVVELVLENAPDELISQILRFMIAIGLPCTLADLGVQVTPEKVRKIAHKTAVENKLIQAEPFFINEDMVYNAIIAADALGQAYKTPLIG
jgi:glycerol dehydrogenase